MYLTYFNDLIAAINKGRIVVYSGNFPITELVVDSRYKAITPFPLFFALVGVNHNGHNYIEEAYQKGIRQFVVNNHYDLSLTKKYSEVNFLQVDHTLHALQQFAIFYRSKYRLPVLGVVGSNGKTMVKEWLHDFLSRKYKTVSNPHSYNSQVGVPLAVSLIEPVHEYAIFEAAISTVNEMKKLARLIQPTHGLFTNIGPAHSQGFQDELQKIKEKAQLFTSCSAIYYCQDHSSIHTALQSLYGGKKKLINWSFQVSTADYTIKRREINKDKTELQIITSGKMHTFLTPFYDNASIENVIHCLVYLLDNGLDPEHIQRSLLYLRNLPMRLTLKTGGYRCKIIDDSYVNDLTSLRIALEFMGRQQIANQTVILSDIVQCDIPALTLYTELTCLLEEYGINKFIGIGPAIGQYTFLFSTFQSSFFNSVEDFLEHKPFFKDEIILVKGARIFRLERIVQAIENPSHRTILEISTHAIRHNLCFFRTKLMASTQIMAIVKASAYGASNGFEIASALQRHGVEYLSVAYLDEAVRLREQGISLPIMVMNIMDDNFDKILHYQLEPSIYSLELLEGLKDFIRGKALSVKIHLKLETGMHRLGIEEEMLEQLIAVLKSIPSLRIVSIFSHLIASDSPEYDAYTFKQAEKFIRMTKYIEEHLKIKPLKHLLNTNGVLRFPQFQFDMVRLGIGLHGVGVSKEIRPYLIPVSKLKTAISQVKQVKKGEAIGYNCKAFALKDMIIATLPLGYADGLSRAFGCGKGKVVIQGHSCPIVGDVCMDMTMVDITNLQTKPRRGEEVIIFSEEHSIDELAESIGTISYEILTQINQRVERIYYT